MSFSKRWFPYTDDAGTVFAVLRDESNTELVSTTADTATVPAGTTPLASGITARYVTLRNADGQFKDCTVLTSAEFVAISNGDAFAGTVYDNAAAATSWVCVRKTPEIARRQPFAMDTGLTDGDNP
jgi:hypothetical protein